MLKDITLSFDSDNGVGANIDNLNNSNKLGYKLIKSIAQNQLQGNIQIYNNSGLTIKITFD